MPEFIGVHEQDDMVLAIVTEYVPDSLDGWDWFVDDVDAWLRDDLHLADLIASGQRMGEMTADLHTVLSGVQRSTVATRTYHAHAIASLHEAVRTVAGDAGTRLRSMEGDVREALEPLRGDRMLPAHRVHGDLHAGQFIRSHGRLLMNDFDGNPLTEPTERRLPQSPLRDVAGLLQSIDHVGRIVVRRRHPTRASDVDQFAHSAIAAALGAYTASHTVDHDVLRALRVAQELHEYCYAAAHLPHWVYVPDAALPPLLQG
jgi:maltokinase